MGTRFRWLGLLIAIGSLGFWSCRAQPQESGIGAPPWDFRPNILWLVAEDLGPYIPPFGDTTVVTLALSRLATEGVRYTHVFSPSGVCAPSRSAIATGMYPTHIGAHHMRPGPWYAADPSPDVLATAAASVPPGVVPYEAVPPTAERRGTRIGLRGETDGASISYQILAADDIPGQAWQVYAEPVVVPPGERLVAVAHRLGHTASDLVTIERQ